MNDDPGGGTGRQQAGLWQAEPPQAAAGRQARARRPGGRGVIGLLAGLYPALRAGTVEPADALRR